jgi:hypothetical protein
MVMTTLAELKIKRKLKSKMSFKKLVANDQLLLLSVLLQTCSPVPAECLKPPHFTFNDIRNFT